MPDPGSLHRGRVRIKDVAAAAGVSITTVSDSLSGKGRLAPATREHVREVAARLGYRPNALARGLRDGRSRLLGLVVTKYGETAWTFTRLPFFSTVVEAAVTAAIDRGYALVVLPAGRHLELWDEIPFDGCYVVDPEAGDPVVGEMRRRGITVVTDRGNAAVAGGPWVDTDHDVAVRMMCDHLSERGARTVGILAAGGADSYTARCVDAYRRWCAERGAVPVVERGGPDEEEVGRAAVRLFDRPEAPDAVFGLEDGHGTQLLAAAARSGLAVPGDVLVACFCEDPAAGSYDPPLTTLSVRPAEIATTSVALLVDAIEGTADRVGGRYVDCDLHPRASTFSPVPG